MSRVRSRPANLTTRDLGQWKLIEKFQDLLQAAGSVPATQGPKGLEGRVVVHSTFADPRRKLQLGHYLSLFLFGLLNPAVRTMRALCEASDLDRMCRDICGRPVSLGSFSEAQDVVDPALLEKVFGDLAKQLPAGKRGPGQPGLPALNSLSTHRWLIVDSTLWQALPRMGWALWRQQGNTQNAVRLHLGLHLLEDHPVTASVTTGRGCERRAWKEQWVPGDAYVGDRNYGASHGVFGELDRLGCAYVLRLRDQSGISVLEELTVTEADRKSGVVRAAWALLGGRPCHRSLRVRLVWVQPADPSQATLILVTNQPPEQLSGAMVSELYRSRWQIELYFRWIKCILGNRHWLAESERGVTLQIYLALIASLLLQLHTGERPSKRMQERIGLYLMGMATLDELRAGLEKDQARRAARLAKKQKP